MSVVFENCPDTYMEGEIAEFTYKLSDPNKPKRKRSLSIFDEESEDMIDRAFRSRLVNKLAFSHRLSSDLDLFQPEIDNMNGMWREYKQTHSVEKEESHKFLETGDAAIKQYLIKCVNLLAEEPSRTGEHLKEIKSKVGQRVNLSFSTRRTSLSSPWHTILPSSDSWRH